MTEKNNEIDVFESLAETMMFRAEDGEKMREDILKIRKTITAIAPAEKKESGGPERRQKPRRRQNLSGEHQRI